MKSDKFRARLPGMTEASLQEHEKWMRRCLELAAQGRSMVAPNPMVGCVIVSNGELVAEGYHKIFGGPHAEVEAIDNVEDASLLSSSTLYVSLEPCVHFGKTPPCTELIISTKIPRVVIGCLDPNPLMMGKGAEALEKAGVIVTTGILREECEQINRRFFTYQLKKRPYIILKWARSADGYIDRKRSIAEIGNQERITGNEANALAHKWRSEEQAILVGTTTALMDNPSLTVRHIEGRNPLRVVVDKDLKIPGHYNIFDRQNKTLVFTAAHQLPDKNIEYVRIDFSSNILEQIMKVLHSLNISSIIVEGGRELMSSFIGEGLWDEARIFSAPHKLGTGVKGPVINKEPFSTERVGLDSLSIYYNS